jgi:UDP-4-amino-4,6-dideoxy-N-acetyl-beta-L-altrosamine transaminase
MIPYGRQDISQQDIDAVIDVLKSDLITQGPQVPLFESVVAEKVGSNHAVAVNSATSALHIACLALELGPRDWLWTSPNTFVASANCGLYCGAKVDFVDIDPQTYNLCPRALEEKLIQAKMQNKLPKILVVVHLCGQPCNMKRIHELSKIFGFAIIEDASHAIGGKYKGKYIGSSQYSDITVFSFHPVKIVTTAEGGMALTNSQVLSERMKLYRSHGITREPSVMKHESAGSWYYEQIVLGFNYRMTDLQAALGISQMDRLDSFVEKRHELALFYNKELGDLPLKLPFQHSDSYSSMHLYVIRLSLDEIEKTHMKVFEELKENGVGVNLHYMPVHTHPFYESMGFLEDDFPESVKYAQEAISLPLFPKLSREDQSHVVKMLRKVLS